jgi:hypothetical protein
MCQTRVWEVPGSNSGLGRFALNGFPRLPDRCRDDTSNEPRLNVRFSSICIMVVSSRLTIDNFVAVVKEPADLNNRQNFRRSS